MARQQAARRVSPTLCLERDPGSPVIFGRTAAVGVDAAAPQRRRERQGRVVEHCATLSGA
jgi:hypothetical protein